MIPLSTAMQISQSAFSVATCFEIDECHSVKMIYKKSIWFLDARNINYYANLPQELPWTQILGIFRDTSSLKVSLKISLPHLMAILIEG